MLRDGQPDVKQARMMAKVFIVATVLGGVAVFLNVSIRSYQLRMQHAELKKQQAGAVVPGSAPTQTAPTGQQQVPADPSPKP